MDWAQISPSLLVGMICPIFTLQEIDYQLEPLYLLVGLFALDVEFHARACHVERGAGESQGVRHGDARAAWTHVTPGAAAAGAAGRLQAGGVGGVRTGAGTCERKESPPAPATAGSSRSAPYSPPRTPPGPGEGLQVAAAAETEPGDACAATSPRCLPVDRNPSPSRPPPLPAPRDRSRGRAGPALLRRLPLPSVRAGRGCCGFLLLFVSFSLSTSGNPADRSRGVVVGNAWIHSLGQVWLCWRPPRAPRRLGGALLPVRVSDPKTSVPAGRVSARNHTQLLASPPGQDDVCDPLESEPRTDRLLSRSERSKGGRTCRGAGRKKKIPANTPECPDESPRISGSVSPDLSLRGSQDQSFLGFRICIKPLRWARLSGVVTTQPHNPSRHTTPRPPPGHVRPSPSLQD
ncbi:uncharacterized protein RHO17_019660 [Thomomys bottae]